MASRHWDLGVEGNLVWRYFPEGRETIARLVADSFEYGTDDDLPPQVLDQFEYYTHVVGPLVYDHLGSRPLDPDLLRRFCAFCRELLAHADAHPGPVAWEIEYHLQMYALYDLDAPKVTEALRAADPELVRIIDQRWPGMAAESTE
ncbi:hypothetical protein [Micromonospora endolithica]|uniref:Uncharacterized protein n=1 Tax=Micromonospora endolithica TaxID=230091 RepID=A0A3A9Z4L2_9ACTN|nr:hypothetical protein [Micromonospora endolithica]RKN43391.1 hypothetical protein D7223_20200 [Micromonospora endolithica]TWJ23947.1 hypothetical protein JD76_04092 [Micromonospora endolithica]